MGNKLFTVVDAKKQKKFEAYVLQNPKLNSRDLLQEGKMFKTYSFSIEGEKNIIMKVFIKREAAELKVHRTNYNYLLSKLSINSLPNLLPYTKYVEEPDFVTIIRQKIHLTLLERAHTIPYLKSSEKIWIVFQLLTAVFNLHQDGLFHGDIKSSNVLLTTWNHILLSDFAWHKPYYLFEDQLGDFQYFFGSSEKHCCLAPEKFIVRESKEGTILPVSEVESLSKETITNLQQMDIFSVGCVIAEIMNGGTPLFTYEQLLSFRRDEYYPHDVLNRIKDEKIRNFVQDIIQKDPNARGKASDLLQRWCKEIAPSFFPKLYYPLNSVIISSNFLLPDQRVALIREMLPCIYEEVLQAEYIPHYEVLPVAIQKFQPRHVFLKNTTYLRPRFPELLGVETPQYLVYKPRSNEMKLMFNGNLEEKEFKQISDELHKRQEERGMKLENSLSKRKKVKELSIIVAILCSNLRSLRYLASKLCVIEMLGNFSLFFSDSMNLHLTIPYLFTLLDDENPQVLSSVFKTFCRVVSSFEKPIKLSSEKKIFEDYLFPNIMKICRHHDLLVAETFTENLHVVIKCAELFIRESNLNVFQDGKVVRNPEPGAISEEQIAQNKKNYEMELKARREEFVRLINDIIMNDRVQVQEKFISSIHLLSEALGPTITEISLLPLAVSCLNSNQNKLASLKAITQMVRLVKETTAISWLKPCFEKCVTSSDELVVWNSMKGLLEIAKTEKFQIESNQAILRQVIPLVLHPNAWIRESVIEFFANVLDKANPEEILFIAQPQLLPYLKKDDQVLLLLNSKMFKMMVLDPLDRRTFEEFKFKGELKLKDPKINIELIKETLYTYIQLQKSDYTEEFRLMDKKIVPKEKKNFNYLVIDMFKKARDRRLFEIQAGDLKSLRSSLFVEEVKKDENKSERFEVNTCLKAFREFQAKVSSDLVYILDQMGANGMNFVYNLQTMNMFLNSLFLKSEQLHKRKERDIGYHERSEKTSIMKNWRPSGFLLTTIYEHMDTVNCLDVTPDGRFFASGSNDGTVKIFDVMRMEKEFSSLSILTMKFFQEKKIQKIKAIKFIDNDLLVVGGDRGIIEVHKLEPVAGGKDPGGKELRSTLLRQIFVKGEVKSIQPLAIGNDIKEKCFIYVTHAGELGIEDISCKTAAMRFDIGKERGMISSLLLSAIDHNVCIGTYSGYLLLYDVRCNLISNFYQASRGTPILSMANYYQLPEPNVKTVQDARPMVMLSFGSDYHEMGIYDILDFNRDCLNPEIYFSSLPSNAVENNIIYLKDVTKYESSFNIRNLFSERMHYDFLAIRSPIYNILSFYSDPLNFNQNMQKEKWLSSSTNSYNQTNSLFNHQNCANKLLSFPKLSNRDLRYPMGVRDAENVIISAGNDMNIRYWNLTYGKYYHVNNVDFKKRYYHTQTDTLTVINEYTGPEIETSNYINLNKANSQDMGFSEYQFKNGCKLGTGSYEKNVLAPAGHKDTITDLIWLENNGLLVTCSRDQTIKVWR